LFAYIRALVARFQRPSIDVEALRVGAVADYLDGATSYVVAFMTMDGGNVALGQLQWTFLDRDEAIGAALQQCERVFGLGVDDVSSMLHSRDADGEIVVTSVTLTGEDVRFVAQITRAEPVF